MQGTTLCMVHISHIHTRTDDRGNLIVRIIFKQRRARLINRICQINLPGLERHRSRIGICNLCHFNPIKPRLPIPVILIFHKLHALLRPEICDLIRSRTNRRRLNLIFALRRINNVKNRLDKIAQQTRIRFTCPNR